MIKLETKIKGLKLVLTEKARNKGIYENFGQKEVRKLEETFINISSYTDEMNEIRNLIQNFNEWCMNFNDKQLNWGIKKNECSRNDDGFRIRI